LSSRPRLYIDTNVLLHYLKTNYRPDFANLARDLVQKIEDGSYEGVVSTLTLAELMKVLREMIVTFEHGHDPTDWNDQIEKGFRSIFSIGNIKVVKQYVKRNNQPLLFDDVVEEGLRIMKQFPGNIVEKDDKETNTKKYRHNGIHSVDAYHIKLAKELQCAKIATFDNDFDETRAEIVPLILHKDKSW
jgi:predicted nucleic acid-binding protein